MVLKILLKNPKNGVKHVSGKKFRESVVKNLC